METSSLGRPLEGLDPGGGSSAPDFPCRKVLALENCIHEAKVRGGHGHGQLRTSGGLPRSYLGPTSPYESAGNSIQIALLLSMSPRSEDCPFPGPAGLGMSWTQAGPVEYSAGIVWQF